MDDRLLKLRDFAQGRGYAQFRSRNICDLREDFGLKGYNFSRRNAYVMKFMCDNEAPLCASNERIGFVRSVANVPRYFDAEAVRSEFGLAPGQNFDVYHNITPDYTILLDKGLGERLDFARASWAATEDIQKRAFFEDVIRTLEAVLALAERYAEAEMEAGNEELAEIFRRVPRHAPRSFHEALQSLRFVSACFYLADNYQIGFGRMDQYLYPFYEKDLKSGKIGRSVAYDLLAEFFISLNKDTDLYRGMQLGDNGQSVMLGGCTASGESAVNDLTYLILEVSRDLRLIDPKINLRIDSRTPQDLIELGCQLTEVGLGFPQYSNDEVVIPALVRKGYSLEDARNYTVAACWEFIIPGQGLDVVNLGAASFPHAVDHALEVELEGGSFMPARFRDRIRQNISEQVANILANNSIRLLPSPFMSVFMTGSLEQGIDASYGARYRNVGIHGAGSANAADALCAIMKIYDEKGVAGLNELRKQKAANFPDEQYHKTLWEEMPKVGNNEPASNAELKFLFDAFADAADAHSSEQCRVRPGTGSAMYYVLLTSPDAPGWMVEPVVEATADGRRAGEPLPSSLAPAHGIRVNGILSVLKSFSNIDYSRIMNGGPITVELSPSVFSSENGTKKLAQLIRYFVKLGNQQLQLNVIDSDRLRAALENPRQYKNLIVRVWGWSGYFCELAPEYQQHIIHRHQYGEA